jgi:uncharacterized protein YbjT (DUF2867 family)
MKVLLFGATGMVGQGVLRECLLDPDVERVTAVVRAASGQTHDKLVEVVHDDFMDYGKIATDLDGHDACLFCLGVSSAGMNEADYTRVTYDLTLAAAQALVRLRPAMTFIYVSGAGTDSTEKGRSMWARVKGRTENALLALPFAHAYMFRPGFIQPRHGVRSKTPLYRVVYVLTTPLAPLFVWLTPGLATTTERVGRAMLHVARHGADKKVLETRDINAIAAGDRPAV